MEVEYFENHTDEVQMNVVQVASLLDPKLS